VDFGKIKLYPGNYDFWYESSQLLLKQKREQNKKAEEKIKELKEFIARFSANASKSKQATSRKKSLEKIELADMTPSNRKYPYVDFKPDRLPGNDILEVKNISKTVNGEKILDNISFKVKADDKIMVLADNENAITFQQIESFIQHNENVCIPAILFEYNTSEQNRNMSEMEVWQCFPPKSWRASMNWRANPEPKD
jgi:ATPase subunit of ABC transporter with duplicated ATPase domains